MEDASQASLARDSRQRGVEREREEEREKESQASSRVQAWCVRSKAIPKQVRQPGTLLSFCLDLDEAFFLLSFNLSRHCDRRYSTQRTHQIHARPHTQTLTLTHIHAHTFCLRLMWKLSPDKAPAKRGQCTAYTWGRNVIVATELTIEMCCSVTCLTILTSLNGRERW